MFNWREVPFVRLLLPFIIGIACSFYFDYSFSFLPFLLLLLLLPIFWMSPKSLGPKGRSYYTLFVNLFLFIFGYHLAYQQNSFHHTDHFRHYLVDKNIGVGTVSEVASSGKFDRVVLNLEQLGTRMEDAKNINGRVLLLVDRTTNEKVIHYGDRIAFKANITPASPPKNPHAFDYRHLLRIRGIYHQAFLKQGDWKRLASEQGSPLMNKTYQLREHLIAVLKKHLPGENEFAVGAAMLLGDKSALQEEVKNAYAGTGATHVMAVSGLHLGIIFLGLGMLLRLIKTRNRFFQFFKPAVMIAGIWAFALLTGGSPSALRAAVMFSFLIVGQSLVRHVNIYNTLAISAFALLCYDPFLLFETGFQLSYFAVVGIIYFQAKVYRLWIIDNKVGDHLWKLVSVGIAAQLTTFPLCLFYFNQFPLYFWLSGLVVVPAAFFIICVGALLFLVEAIFPLGAIWIGKLLHGIIWLMNALIFMIHQLPAGLIEGIWISALVFVLLYLVVLAVSVAINTEKKKWWVYSLGFLTVVAGSYAFTSVSQEGQQQIILYHTGRNTLIDFIDGTDIVSFQNEVLTDKSKNFAAQRNRWALGANNIESFTLDKNPKVESRHLHYQNGLIQFHNKTIALVNELPDYKERLTIPVDYLILYENPDLSIDELKQFFDFKEIWIASSNNRFNSNRWIDECMELNIIYRSVNGEGAIIKKTNPAS